MILKIIRQQLILEQGLMPLCTAFTFIVYCQMKKKEGLGEVSNTKCLMISWLLELI